MHFHGEHESNDGENGEVEAEEYSFDDLGQPGVLAGGEHARLLLGQRLLRARIYRHTRQSPERTLRSIRIPLHRRTIALFLR